MTAEDRFDMFVFNLSFAMEAAQGMSIDLGLDER